jgi:signal peptidase I
VEEDAHTKLSPLLLSLFFIATLAGVVGWLMRLGYGITYVDSPSVPVGFYLIKPVSSQAQQTQHHLHSQSRTCVNQSPQLQRFDLVQFRASPTIARFLAEQRWGAAARSGMLLKYIYGLPGDFVCIKRSALWINNQRIAPIHADYAPGKQLPHHHFCGKLAADQYLLLSLEHDRSFDGRYFGPTPRSDIVGKARKL